MNYTRETINHLGPTGDRSLIYWRREVQKVFDKNSHIQTVEVIRSGRKTDSSYLPRGVKSPPAGVAVLVASTSGRFGRPRRDYIASA